MIYWFTPHGIDYDDAHMAQIRRVDSKQKSRGRVHINYVIRLCDRDGKGKMYRAVANCGNTASLADVDPAETTYVFYAPTAKAVYELMNSFLRFNYRLVGNRSPWECLQFNIQMLGCNRFVVGRNPERVARAAVAHHKFGKMIDKKGKK